MALSFEQVWDRIEDAIRTGREDGYGETVRENILSNLHRLFPKMTLEQMQRTSDSIYLWQRRSALTVRFFRELVPQIAIDDRSDYAWQSKPAIFCTYHYGHYRLVPPLLASLGAPLTIVMDKAVANRQEAAFTEALEDYMVASGRDRDSFSFRDTSDSALMLALTRDVRRGRSVLFYIDGNTGVDGGKPSVAHSVAVPFLQHKLISRIGIPALGAITKAPLIPVIMDSVMSGSDTVRLAPAIHPGDEERTAFALRSLELVWDILAQSVGADPTQWESFRYANKYIEYKDPIDLSEKVDFAKPVEFDKRRFVFRDDVAEAMLFDRAKALLYPVGKQLGTILNIVMQARSGSTISDVGLSQDVGEWLAERGIIRNSGGLSQVEVST